MCFLKEVLLVNWQLHQQKFLVALLVQPPESYFRVVLLGTYHCDKDQIQKEKLKLPCQEQILKNFVPEYPKEVKDPTRPFECEFE